MDYLTRWGFLRKGEGFFKFISDQHSLFRIGAGEVLQAQIIFPIYLSVELLRCACNATQPAPTG